MKFNLYGSPSDTFAEPMPIPWMDAHEVLKAIGWKVYPKNGESWVWDWRAKSVKEEDEEEEEDFVKRVGRAFDDTILTFATFQKMLLALHENAIDDVAREERSLIDELLGEAIDRAVETSCTVAEVVNPLFEQVVDKVLDQHIKGLEAEVNSIILGSMEGAMAEAERNILERRKLDELMNHICQLIEYDIDGDNLSVSSGDLSSLPLSVGSGGTLSMSSGDMSSLAFAISGVELESGSGSISVSSGDMSSLAQTEGSEVFALEVNKDEDTISVSSGEMSSLPPSPPESPRPPPSPLLAFLKKSPLTEGAEEPPPSPLFSHKNASPFR